MNTHEDSESKIYDIDNLIYSIFSLVIKGCDYYYEEQFNDIKMTNDALSIIFNSGSINGNLSKKCFQFSVF